MQLFHLIQHHPELSEVLGSLIHLKNDPFSIRINFLHLFGLPSVSLLGRSVLLSQFGLSLVDLCGGFFIEKVFDVVLQVSDSVRQLQILPFLLFRKSFQFTYPLFQSAYSLISLCQLCQEGAVFLFLCCHFGLQINHILAKTPLTCELHLFQRQWKLFCFRQYVDWHEESLVVDPEGGRAGEIIELLQVFKQDSEFNGKLIIGVDSAVDLQLMGIFNVDGECIGIVGETHFGVVGSCEVE